MVREDVTHSLAKRALEFRVIEQYLIRAYETDIIKSPCHFSVGEELLYAALATSVIAEDRMWFASYRCHLSYLARTQDVTGFLAELYGLDVGCSRGLGGSMHLGDPLRGHAHSSAIVSTQIPLAVGFAYSMKINSKSLQENYKGSLAIFGDGATEEGVFWESLNLAILLEAPTIFLCIDNGLAINIKRTERQVEASIATRVRSFGIPTYEFDLTNPGSCGLNNMISTLNGDLNGPVFLAVKLVRMSEHVGPKIMNEYVDSICNSKDSVMRFVQSRLSDEEIRSISTDTINGLNKRTKELIKDAL